MKKLFKRLFASRTCRWCGKEKDSFYGDMCTDCMSQ
jgi:NMD protein affecting ribosome stability and mRNA decay